MKIFKDIWQGAEACAQGAMKAGLDFFAGYPITPSTEVAEHLSNLLPKKGKTFIQMEDEIASIVAIVGASMAGAKAMTATSGPGFSLMQEGIGYACMVEAPIVICNVMRGGPSTGLPTKVSQGDVMQTKWGTHGDHPSIVLSPASVQEMHDMTIQAFNLAERFRNPVILLTDETITHMREKIEFDTEAETPLISRTYPASRENYKPYGQLIDDVPVMAKLGDGYGTSITALSHLSDGFQTADYQISRDLIERLNRKVDKHAKDLFELEVWNGDAPTMIVCYGISARTVQALMARENHPEVGMIRLKTLFPFHDESLWEKVKHARQIIVPELNLGQIFLEVQRAVGHRIPVSLLSKTGGNLINPDELSNEIERISKHAR
jgi:2-oxoglutarate/2-oxoacid ferredoxin oxidoreductase subunit alpha